LSRSDIHYFKHNDMQDLERLLVELDAKEKAMRRKKGGAMRSGGVAPLHRKFIVLEGVSSLDGTVAPLPQVVKLKEQYHYRLIMDDSLGFGTLGARGRGTLEHHGLEYSVADAVTVSMDGALGSVGGFCVGAHNVVDHQRLSGAGYCFSASSPPYTSTASLHALAAMQAQPQLTASLQAKAQRVRKALAQVHRRLAVQGGAESAESPVIHLVLSDHKNKAATAADRALFEALHHGLLALPHRIACSVPEFIPADRAGQASPASLRIVLSVLHTDADIDRLVKAVQQVAQEVFAK